MGYLSSEELSALLIARKTLKDISGGILEKEISSILNKITNILTKHNVKADSIGTLSPFLPFPSQSPDNSISMDESCHRSFPFRDEIIQSFRAKFIRIFSESRKGGVDQID